MYLQKTDDASIPGWKTLPQPKIWTILSSMAPYPVSDATPKNRGSQPGGAFYLYQAISNESFDGSALDQPGLRFRNLLIYCLRN